MSQFPFGFGAAGHSEREQLIHSWKVASQFPFGFGAAGHTGEAERLLKRYAGLNSLSGLVLPVTS